MWLGRFVWLVVGVVAAVVALFDLCICPMWPFRFVVGITLVISTIKCPLVVVAVFVAALLSGDILTGGILVSILAIIWALRQLDMYV